MSNDILLLKSAVEHQEEVLQFDSFSREDALALGLLIADEAKNRGVTVAIDITLGGLQLFHYAMEGTNGNNARWILRKANTVFLTHRSSLHLYCRTVAENRTLESMNLSPAEFCAAGGGFPIRLRGTGVVGVICVSNLAHMDDHALIVDSLCKFLHTAL